MKTKQFVPLNERTAYAQLFEVAAGYTGEASLECPMCNDYIDMDYREKWTLLYLHALAMKHMHEQHNTVSM
jgi:hypothetical protein